MITPEQVRAALRAEPFRSLKFLRPDDRGYAIASRPAAVAYDGGTTAVVTFPDGNTEVIDLATWGLDSWAPHPCFRASPIDRVRERHEYLDFEPDDPESAQRLGVTRGDRVVTVPVPRPYDYPVGAVLRAAAGGDLFI